MRAPAPPLCRPPASRRRLSLPLQDHVEQQREGEGLEAEDDQQQAEHPAVLDLGELEAAIDPTRERDGVDPHADRAECEAGQYAAIVGDAPADAGGEERIEVVEDARQSGELNRAVAERRERDAEE